MNIDDKLKNLSVSDNAGGYTRLDDEARDRYMEVLQAARKASGLTTETKEN